MKINVRASLIGATALTALTFVPALAVAQTAPAAPAAPESAPAKQAETIIVTGSRIRRDTFNTASPLTVITNDNAVLSGTIDAAEILQGSTAAAGSGQINNFFAGFIVEGGPGIQTVGLNSLGAQRTLVLLNGRRLPPSGVRGQVGAVDLQTIPNIAVNRYEILNEGASPIYGSDAVGGVVNAIVRKNVNGFEATASGNMTEAGGGEQFTVGALWGKTADRWNVMVTGSYFEQKPLKYGDRNYCQQDYVFDAVTGQRADFIDPKTGQPKCFGIGPSFNRIAPLGSALTGTGTWVSDPSVTARTTGLNPSVRPVTGSTTLCQLPTGATATCASQQVLLTVPGYRRLFSPAFGVIGSPVANQVDYEHPLVANTDIISPSKRTNIYGTAARDLDILGGVEVYSEFIYAKRESSQERAAQLFFQIPATNAFNPFGVTAQPVIVRPANSQQEVETWQVVGGIKGQTGNGLAGFLKNGGWDVYAQTSRGEGTYTGTAILADRLSAMAQATRNPTTGVVSCPTPVLSGGTCLPINFFDPRVLRGDFTQEEFNYLFNNPNQGKTVYEQTVVDANVSGDVFEIPGASGPSKLVLGGQYRKYSINDVPGPETLRGNIALTTSAGITKGEDTVKEFYTELEMPLVAKKPLIEDLQVNLAYRYTDYDSYDSNSTWKATANWKITPEFSIVAIAGTSYRAPALFELFLGDQTGFLSQASIDPCINHDLSSNAILKARCTAAGIPGDYNGATNGTSQSATIFTGGGAGTLKEEESRSDIFSFVYTPTKFDLNLRIDYWQIEVTDQVAQFGAGNIVGSCYAATDVSRANQFCGLFTRDTNPASPRFRQILTVSNDYVNVNVQQVEGIDLKATYRKDFAFGDFIIDTAHRWTLSNKGGLFSDSTLIESAGDIGEPIYNSQTQFRFERKDWTYTWSVDAIGQTNQTDFNNGINPVTALPGSYYAYNGISSVRYKTKTEAVITHGVSVRYRSDNWTIVGGIRNLFDEPPPSISTSVFFSRLGNSALTSQYDQFGRSFNASIIRRF
ncbi:vitamin B12 transporter BtuB [Candidatus Phycosocius bacilliformis]|uniref:Vitamin B12 transporter BtuB n=1 Tax=Candidatus Phycosocius bacilliformis TaxID=1445552 RepID=A0A2P2ECW6_9PROT|nr:TonB-dependent receptor [Candidatus Phycosocius bacilliformis]GBF58891.1 vitamin B12 transporter BtuB [Candidatus Phycosocius bacilliformis]